MRGIKSYMHPAVAHNLYAREWLVTSELFSDNIGITCPDCASTLINKIIRFILEQPLN